MSPIEPEDHVLDSVAGAIVDGVAVDWQIHSSQPPGIAGRIAQLRALESIARAHREFAAGLGLGSGPESTLSQATGPAAPGFSWGPLQVFEKLGEGSFGEVYRALDPALNREVALKLRRPVPGSNAIERQKFLAEARRLARIRHENVLTIYGADEHDGRVGMWVDLIRGKSLTTLLAEQGPYGSHEAALVGVALCRALAALHAVNLMHRDLKPANVLRETGGRIVLVDFGCALETDLMQHQRAGIAGTPATMAPEILLQTAPAGPAADIYSLGVMLYWLASGKYPVLATTMEGFLEAHRRGESVPLRGVRPDLPADFVQVVERATARRIEERYATVGDLERDLVRHTGGAVSPAPVEPTVRLEAARPKRRPGRRQAVLLASAAATAVLLVLAAFAWRAWRAPLRVEAALFRQIAGAAEPLAAGALVHPGDHVFLEIETSKPAYVYVLDQDAHGKRFVLSSPEDTEALPARARHRLPAAAGSTPQSWIVTGDGGAETIAVIAARERLLGLEAVIQDYEHVELNQTALRQRGFSVVPEPGSPLAEFVQRYEKQAWVWVVPLQGGVQ